MQGRLSRVEEILGHHFDDQSLIAAAVTHPSAAEGLGVAASYERLEFLGDAVLGAVVSTYLFERFDDMREGELTRLKISLVSGKTLSEVADDLGLAPLILMGESEKGTHARGMRHALENVYEAIVAALFLDAGIEVARSFIERTLLPHLDPTLAEHPLSAKSMLQQVTQRDMRCAPDYRLIERKGPAHSPVFVSAVFINGEQAGVGEGGSKKDSESSAAEHALIALGYLTDRGQQPADAESDVPDEEGIEPCI